MWRVIRAPEMASVSVFSLNMGLSVSKTGIISLPLAYSLSLRTCQPLAIVLRWEIHMPCWVFVFPILFLHTEWLNSGLQTYACYMVRILGGGTHLGSQTSCMRTPLEKVCRGHELALNPLVKSRWSQTIVSVCCKWYASGFEQSSAKSPTWHGNLSWSQVCRVKVM